MKPIHEKIRLIRQAKGWTQEEVAERLNLSVNGYGDIERGHCDIRLTRLEEIAHLFGMELVDLLGVTDRTIINLFGTNSGTQNNHNYSSLGATELQAELEKQLLIIQLKDKEIELLEEKIRHLMEVNELLRNKQ